MTVGDRDLTPLALLFHECATNAAKYGALSTPDGRIVVECAVGSDKIEFLWREIGGPILDAEPDTEGFGSFLARATVEQQLGGSFGRSWARDGISIRITVMRDQLGGSAVPPQSTAPNAA